MNAVVHATQGSSMPIQASEVFLSEIWQALGGDVEFLKHLQFTGVGQLRSVFPVNELAAAAIGAAGLAISELVGERIGESRAVQVDRRLASFWFQSSLRADGWELPPVWDAVAGDYQTADGWIRLHTNAPHHRDAALAVLGVSVVGKEAVTEAVAAWRADELEAAVVAHGGCAAAMRSVQEWAAHPQGQAVNAEPLLHCKLAATVKRPQWENIAEAGTRPLAGIRVLDLTRVLAGPVATRFLAGYGANVLRIDSPSWDEPSLVPEVTLGKRLARLDLHGTEDRAKLEALLRQADVIVHGYRPDALDRLGLDAKTRRDLNPGLIDVCLDAYGWTGPWCDRRGFDSLLQMSSGIADAGMRVWKRDRPTPLPAQALDHATGYIMAAAVIRGLVIRLRTGMGSTTRASLARTAALLTSFPAQSKQEELQAEGQEDINMEVLEMTEWGKARRLKAPVVVSGAPMQWDYPAASLGSAVAAW